MIAGFIIGLVLGFGMCWLWLRQMRDRLVEVTELVKTVTHGLADANALMRIQTARIAALELENNQFKSKPHSVGDEDRFAA